MSSSALPLPRLTPWVLRLLVTMAVVQLLLATIFTSPAAFDLLTFDPARGLGRPWTVLSYAFVHVGLLHLLFNGVMLAVFGPAVERRLGGPAFLLYYVYCAVGAAAFALLLNKLYAVPPFVGASGAILGVLLAYAVMYPDQELILFPIPIPITARQLVFLYAAVDILGVLVFRRFGDGTAHEAHLGGLLFGWLFFRLQGLGAARLAPAPPPRALQQPAAVGGREERPRVSTPAPRLPASDPVQAELDRVLDKISAKGMASLTPAERKFLDEVARKKKEH